MDFDFETNDVDKKDFPGLYAAEGDSKSRKSKEESDYSDGDHDKVSKKELLIGRRKDKKEKSKDRGYAALEGEESCGEDELDAKSPSKSKKTKAFKFTSSKSKEKREKSRDKEKQEKDLKEEERPKEKEKLEKDKEEKKKKDKERKDKDKKEKSKDKDKDKKDKKAKQPSVASTEVLELGDVQPVFGVSISLATERSRCHDGVGLPLVVRDCIDHLQANLNSDQIYKVEPLKTRLQHYKRLYNNRERNPETDDLDIPTACGLLKLFLRELPEPILTTDLIARYEEVASYSNITKQQEELQQLIEQLPSCNRTMLAWILLHFDAIIQNEKCNKMNAQILATILSPPLQMSHRLLVTLLCHCSNLFTDVNLVKYVPPLTSSSPKLPDTPEDIQVELRKQESLLAQIHSDMNAGFVSKKREEQLWEVQRIITQLKRKLRSFEKKMDKSMEEVLQPVTSVTTLVAANSKDTTDVIKTKSATITKQAKINCSDDETIKTTTTAITEIQKSPQLKAIEQNQTNQNPAVVSEDIGDSDKNISPIPNVDGLYVDDVSGFMMVPKTHPDYIQLIRLQLENQELLGWKSELQTRISAERAEILHLKQMHQQQVAAAVKTKSSNNSAIVTEEGLSDGDEYEKIIENYVRENALLEQKKAMLTKEIFDEKRECIALQVELALQQH